MGETDQREGSRCPKAIDLKSNFEGKEICTPGD
jgi:hypothetical protein